MQPTTLFRSGLRTLKTCSTCRERRARGRQPAQQRVAVALLPEAEPPLNSRTKRRRVVEDDDQLAIIVIAFFVFYVQLC